MCILALDSRTEKAEDLGKRIERNGESNQACQLHLLKLERLVGSVKGLIDGLKRSGCGQTKANPVPIYLRE